MQPDFIRKLLEIFTNDEHLSITTIVDKIFIEIEKLPLNKRKF